MTSWLVTSTFYGQWLPGDPRGSVTNVRDRRACDPDQPVRIEHAHLGEDYEEPMVGLQLAAIEQLKGPPIALTLSQAEPLFDQFQETARIRRWTLPAVSIMFNHIHMVVGAPSKIGKKELLRDFKSYGAGRLNRLFGKPISDTWWTESGSCRPIRHLPSAIFYVCHRQPNPLVVWSAERGRIPPSESHPDNVYPGDLSTCEPLSSEPRSSELPVVRPFSETSRL